MVLRFSRLGLCSCFALNLGSWGASRAPHMRLLPPMCIPSRNPMSFRSSTPRFPRVLVCAILRVRWHCFVSRFVIWCIFGLFWSFFFFYLFLRFLYFVEYCPVSPIIGLSCHVGNRIQHCDARWAISVCARCLMFKLPFCIWFFALGLV